MVTYYKVLELWIEIFNIFDVAIVINHGHKWQVVPLANSIIIVIMSWSYLNRTLNTKNEGYVQRLTDS